MELGDREESQNVEDRRGMGGGTKLAIGGGAGGIIVLILALLFGINPQLLQQFLGNGGAPAQLNQGPRKVNPAEDEACASHQSDLRRHRANLG